MDLSAIVEQCIADAPLVALLWFLLDRRLRAREDADAEQHEAIAGLVKTVEAHDAEDRARFGRLEDHLTTHPGE